MLVLPCSITCLPRAYVLTPITTAAVERAAAQIPLQRCSHVLSKGLDGGSASPTRHRSIRYPLFAERAVDLPPSGLATWWGKLNGDVRSSALRRRWAGRSRRLYLPPLPQGSTQRGVQQQIAVDHHVGCVTLNRRCVNALPGMIVLPGQGWPGTSRVTRQSLTLP